MTHTGPNALTAACVMSACAAWALEGAPPDVLLRVAVDEAAATGPGTAVAAAVTEVSRGEWTAPAGGITLDPAETVAAVLHCCRNADGDLAAALRLAVGLGGDTDTVAALVGGLLGCGLSPAAVEERLGWLGRVSVPPRGRLTELAGALAEIRLGSDG